MLDPHENGAHTALDLGTLILIMGAFVGYLPPIAAFLAACWYVILIYDRIRYGRKRS